MVAALAGAGFYLGTSSHQPSSRPTKTREVSRLTSQPAGRSPTTSTSENTVGVAKDGMPWEGNTQGKYQYYPGGDPRNPPKDAPSALNTVVVPNVTLPRELHDKFNKWGKDGYP